jgi:hypothetical protein
MDGYSVRDYSLSHCAYGRASILLDWIRDNKILELIFEHQHQSLISRSHYVMRFLAVSGRWTQNLLKMVWESTADKHETIRIAMYEALGAAVVDFTADQRTYLLSKLSAQRPQDVIPPAVKLLEDITKHLAVEDAMLALNQIWSLCKDEAVDVKPEVSKYAQEAIVRLSTSHTLRITRRLEILKSHLKLAAANDSPLQRIAICKGQRTTTFLRLTLLRRHH